MSLPRIFRTSIDTIPTIPNFKAFEVSKDIEALSMYDIGILWQGSKSHNNDINRSIPIKYIKQFVLNNSNLRFINLQLDNDEDLSNISNISCHSDKIKTIDDTLAILHKCKIVITVDSMIAHLAGSANIPTYILHAYSPDWRWLIDRKDSPWYPSITNIRQKQLRDWHSVFDQLDQEIKSVFDSKINID
jgi:ADP-heptose:LPS heptosyltransferase